MKIENNEAKIWHILNSIDVEYESPSQIAELEENCINELNSIVNDYHEQFSSISKEILILIPQDILDREYKLQLLIGVLSSCQPSDALDLIILALDNDNIEDKEFYLTMAADIGEARAVPAVARVMNKYCSNETEEERFCYQSIDTLRVLGAGELFQSVMPYINDTSYKVRGAVIDFLFAFDIRESEPILIKQLMEEDIPENVEKLIDVLVSWNTISILPWLRNFSQDNWVQQDSILKKAVLDAIFQLESLSTNNINSV